jgi:hypothetical protein
MREVVPDQAGHTIAIGNDACRLRRSKTQNNARPGVAHEATNSFGATRATYGSEVFET